MTKPYAIVCSICGRGPAREDGAQALFIDGPTHFCAEHMPLDAMRARIERRPGDADVLAVFRRREQGQAQSRTRPRPERPLDRGVSIRAASSR